MSEHRGDGNASKESKAIDGAKTLVGFLFVFFLVIAPFAAMVRAEAGFIALGAALVIALLFFEQSGDVT